jgi:hypothetical protein
MRSKLFTTLVVAVGVLLALGTLGPVRTDAQTPDAKVVGVEGATRKVQVRDWDGKLVEVEVPSQSLSAIESSNGGQRSTTSGMAQDTLMTTVVAVDQQNNRVHVLTEAGRTIVLEMPAGNIQVGEKLALVVP